MARRPEPSDALVGAARRARTQAAVERRRSDRVRQDLEAILEVRRRQRLRALSIRQAHRRAWRDFTGPVYASSEEAPAVASSGSAVVPADLLDQIVSEAYRAGLLLHDVARSLDGGAPAARLREAIDAVDGIVREVRRAVVDGPRTDSP